MNPEQELRELTKNRQLNIEFIDNSERRKISTKPDIWADFWRVELNVPGSGIWRTLGEGGTKEEAIEKAIAELKSMPGLLEDLQKGIVRKGEYFRYGVD